MKKQSRRFSLSECDNMQPLQGLQLQAPHSLSTAALSRALCTHTFNDSLPVPIQTMTVLLAPSMAAGGTSSVHLHSAAAGSRS
jgi:hypothetical protein